MHTVATILGGSVATQEDSVILHLPIQSHTNATANTWETALFTTCGKVGETTITNIVFHSLALNRLNIHIFSVSSSFEFVIKSNTIAISFGFDCVNCYRAYFLYQYWQDIFKSALNQIGMALSLNQMAD